MSEHVTNVRTDDFKTEVLDSDIPVVVDFWAEWCMPCKMIAPVVDELSKDYKGKVKFAKVNVDDNTQLATDLHVMSIPLLVFFKNGTEITRMVGANPKQAVQKEIEEALLK